MKYKQVIIWGYPLYSHTHSYIHDAYYRTFKYLGYDVYWFHDQSYPENFDFKNSLFITEGFADKNIPINNSSCYCVMYCPQPLKYQEAERYIDVRNTAINFKDHVYDYSLDKTKAIDVGDGCYFEPKQKIEIHHKNKYYDQIINDYDKFYLNWATNLLPHEIDVENIYKPRSNHIYFCGTLSDNGVCENMSKFRPFIQACQKNHINFIHNDPWVRPLSNEDVMKLIQSSILGVDIRGPEHLKQQLVTCRIFKNISYGHLGLTNSSSIYEAMDGNCVYQEDTEQLFYDGMKNKDNFPLIVKGMEYVKEHHTYINRINSLFSIL